MQLQQALKQVIQAFQGVGARLYIFPQGVQQHDGQIWVESRFGAGSAFYFTIPVFSNELRA